MVSMSLQKSGQWRVFSLSLHVRTQQEDTHLQAGNDHLLDHQLAESGVRQELNLSGPLILDSLTLVVRTKCLVKAVPMVVVSGGSSCWSRGPPSMLPPP